MPPAPPPSPRYGLLGEHLSHSFSPQLHALIAPYRYDLIELPPDKVSPFLARRDFAGLNVTIPYKQTVIPLLDDLSDDARAIGAVNTIVNRDGRLVGHNTDAAGFAALLRLAHVAPAGLRCLVLGTGGTSRTVAHVLRTLGAASVTHLSRAPAPPDVIAYADAPRLRPDAELIVNTTPVGMHPRPDASPLPLSPFPALRAVIDVIYNPLRTRLVLSARARSIPAEGGLYMLAAQAVHASALFRSIPPDPALADHAYRALLARQQNLVLIGMPSAGKTTIGRLLADHLRRPFLDTDTLIAQRAGRPVPDLITSLGEPAFRDLERSAIAQTALLSSHVIATGGGAILDPRNLDALRQNGFLIFLDRPPSLLRPTPDRPLSATPSALAALYARRLPLYRAAADLSIDASPPPPAILSSILSSPGVAAAVPSAAPSSSSLPSLSSLQSLHP